MQKFLSHIVLTGLDPVIHALLVSRCSVDTRVKPAHDEI
jgi:hypothetical protein